MAERLPGRSVGDANTLLAIVDELPVPDAGLSDPVGVGGLRGVQTSEKLRLSVA
ncbi:hypothetical protein [Streptomyces sulphureus]|uniref:hypothetical protein n=1 Tax=Streptomyces sulphureus TaxID=47758 RepID=UPI00035F1E28|nr:hypothetical protein [Streptomyces sulphureus]